MSEQLRSPAVAHWSPLFDLHEPRHDCGPGCLVFVPVPVLPVTEEYLQEMVNRFLSWRLPEDFAPDGGVCFEGGSPIGTNLFTAAQAEAMIRHLLDAPTKDQA